MAHTYRDIPSAGTDLQLKITGVFTSIPGATDISWDGYKRGVRQPTKLTDTSVAKSPGMPDFGQVKLKVFFDPNDATHQLIRDKLQSTAAYATANIDDWKLIWGGDGYATPANMIFKGFVSEFSHSATDPETGTVTADMTVEVKSITSITAGSPAE